MTPWLLAELCWPLCGGGPLVAMISMPLDDEEPEGPATEPRIGPTDE